MAIKAVIFDLDGVLMDTELLAFKSWQQKLSPMGFMLGEDDFRAMLGLDAHQTVYYVRAKTGLESDIQVLLEEQEKMMLSILEGDIVPMPGALDLLLDLFTRGYPLAVASNSSSAYVRRALKGLHLDSIFRAVIGCDQVQAGKPAPDVYLAAAAALSVLPSQCLAVEDSSVGVKAAVAAGMHCLAIPAPSLPHAEFGLASATFDSLPSLHAALDAILTRYLSE
jgi:HAD superfamily hydrolase (TIGR01509 family)